MFLGVGAAAGAFVAIINAVDESKDIVTPDPDVQDQVTITSVEPAGMTTLSQFVDGRRPVAQTLEPVTDTTDQAGAGGVVPIRVVVDPGVPVESRRAPTPSSGPSPGPDRTPGPTPGPTAGLAPTPEPTSGRTSSPTPGPSVTSTAPSPAVPTSDPLEVIAMIVSQDPQVDGFGMTRDEIEAVAPHHVASIDVSAVDPDASPGAGASPLSPGQVADELTDSLRQVRSSGTGSEHEWHGHRVSVDMTVEGMPGESMLLLWSLDGTEQAAHWSAERLAYSLLATSDRDRGSLDIWVPELEGSPDYVINVRIVQDGDVLASETEPLQPDEE